MSHLSLQQQPPCPPHVHSIPSTASCHKLLHPKEQGGPSKESISHFHPSLWSIFQLSPKLNNPVKSPLYFPPLEQPRAPVTTSNESSVNSSSANIIPANKIPLIFGGDHPGLKHPRNLLLQRIGSGWDWIGDG